MDINLLSKSYFVRKLHKNDIDIIYNLSSKNELFYKYHPPFVTEESILDDMNALPLGKSMDDKYYVGFFEQEVLVAVLDLILGYPEKETVYIGLFMTDVEYQGKGIGSQIINDVVAYLKSLGYNKTRLGVDKGNPQSNAFWRKNGFQVVSEEKYIEMELMM